MRGGDPWQRERGRRWRRFASALTLPLLLVPAVGTAQTASRDGICDRTPVVHQQIVANLPGIDDCANVLPEDLSGLTGTLDLSRANLAALQSDDLAGLSGLTHLRLNNNRLTALPATLFRDLDSLEFLSLSDNRFATLPNTIFQGLDTLTRLLLNGNDGIVLPANVFQPLTRLEELELSRNRFTTLPTGIFRGLRNLEELDLNQNRLTTLPENTFNGLSNLERLYLYENRLTTLPARLFRGLRNLSRLELDRNRLASLPAGLFQELGASPSLDVLKLNNNQLTSLSAEIFRGLADLNELHLDTNQLTSLPAGLFEGLADLRKIYLGYNRITTLPPRMFEGLPLEVLQLHHNQFTRLPTGFFTGMTGDGAENVFFHENPTEGPTQYYPEYPFTLTVEAGENFPEVTARIAEGVPRETVLDLSSDGRPVGTLTIAAGSDEGSAPAAAPAGATVTVSGRVGDARTHGITWFRGFNFVLTPQSVVLSDGVAISIAAASPSVNEGGTATFTLTANEAPTQTLTINIALAGDLGTGVAATQSVTLNARATRTTFTVAAARLTGGNGAITATVRDGSGYAIGLASVAGVTVTDTDGGTTTDIEVWISGASANRVQEGGRVTFTLTASRTPATPLAVMVDVAGDGVTASERGSRSVTIDTGSARATFEVAARPDDVTALGNRAMTVIVRNGTGYRVDAPAMAVATVWEDDLASTRVALSISPEAINEGDSATTVTVTARLDRGAFPNATNVEITFGLAGQSTTTVDPMRFTITLAAGATTAEGTFTVTSSDDAVFRSGRITVSGTHASLPVNAATLLVRDNDPVGADVNSSGSLDASDALIMYYAYSLRSELGTGR